MSLSRIKKDKRINVSQKCLHSFRPLPICNSLTWSLDNGASNFLYLLLFVKIHKLMSAIVYSKSRHIFGRYRSSLLVTAASSLNALYCQCSCYSTTGYSQKRQELNSVYKWRDSALNSQTALYDCMDARPLTLLDQTIRPYLPSHYPPLVHHNPKYGDNVSPSTTMVPAAHLVYFPSSSSELELSSDGYHADEAPPHPFSQRVWAGGIMEFNPHNPLTVGIPTTQTKRITNVAIKERSDADPLVFVTLSLEMSNDQGTCVHEQRQLAYMKPVQLARRIVRHKKHPDFTHSLTPTEIFLFRYSALTWNSHRIHYDVAYAQNVENHPGLLVHGPLTCTLLLNFLRAHMPSGMTLKSFGYRALSPLYCQQPLSLNGRWLESPSSVDQNGSRKCELWVSNNEGGLAMKGIAAVAPCK